MFKCPIYYDFRRGSIAFIGTQRWGVVVPSLASSISRLEMPMMELLGHRSVDLKECFTVFKITS